MRIFTLLFLLTPLLGFAKEVNQADPKYIASDYFEIDKICSDLQDPMEMAVSKDEKVFIIERQGAVKLYEPRNNKTTKIHQINVFSKENSTVGYTESGGLGIALDPDFDKNSYVYIYYSLFDTAAHRLARFTYQNHKLIDEKSILDVPVFRGQRVCHEGGSLCFGNGRELFLSTGDNTCPFASDGYAPIDEREGRMHYDAQRSSGNSNDLRGSILRIIINKDASYSIPKGNLYPKGMAKTRPEIYIKGCRNPYRISYDKKKDLLYWGDVGPDARGNNPNRGPHGMDELKQARKAGFFGWPYFRGKLQAYTDYDFAKKKSGKSFAEKLINDSPNNTGLSSLPPAQSSFISYGYGHSKEFPELGSGGRTAMAGPSYYTGLKNSFPGFFDNSVLFYDWNRAKMCLIKLDKDSNYASTHRFLNSERMYHPTDLEIGPKGDIYLLEYGSNWFQNTNSALKKISFEGYNRKPVVNIQSSANHVGIPASIHFSSKGSHDPEGTPIKYEWTVDGKNFTSENFDYEFSKASIYTIKLKVTDSDGMLREKSLALHVGNEAPKVKLKLLTAQKTFKWGEEINYQIKVTDKEDAQIDLSKVTVEAQYFPSGQIPKGDKGKQLDPRLKGMNSQLPGTNLLIKNACIACHNSQERSVGPSFTEIAVKYADKKGADKKLLAKIQQGGSGVWGKTNIMPPHIHIAPDDIKKMIKSIFAIKQKTQFLSFGNKNSIKLKDKPEDPNHLFGVYRIRASYTDTGANGMPATSSSTQDFILQAPEAVFSINKPRNVIPAKFIKIHGKNAKYDGNKIINYSSIDTKLIWNIDIEKPGTYECYIFTANKKEGADYELHSDGQIIKGKTSQSKSWNHFKKVLVGSFTFKKGLSEIQFVATKKNSILIGNIQKLELSLPKAK